MSHMDDTHTDAIEPLSTDDTIGHLAEDAAITDDELTAETGLERDAERVSDVATAFPPD